MGGFFFTTTIATATTLMFSLWFFYMFLCQDTTITATMFSLGVFFLCSYVYMFSLHAFFFLLVTYKKKMFSLVLLHFSVEVLVLCVISM